MPAAALPGAAIAPGLASGANHADDDDVDYYYEGHCPRTGQRYALPRTALARAVAQGLMAQLQPLPLAEGKMYGVLLGRRPEGDVAVLKAFSGLWQGRDRLPGWVPPVPGREQVALQEASTLDQLRQIQDRLIALQADCDRDRPRLAQLQANCDRDRAQLNQRHRDRKQARDRTRQAPDLTAADRHALEQQSRGDKAELRAFKQQWCDRLAPLEAQVERLETEAAALRRRRRELSRQLQADLHAAHRLTNFRGESAAVQTFGALPTGTGDCCAPKLLHWAAQHGLRPLALAEFWWGPPQGDRQPGQFYGACAERCQPILGFLLAGLSARVMQAAAPGAEPALAVVYRDEWLIAVDKPAGLLSVPGRYGDRQDSVLTRLESTLPKGAFLRPVHRLDQDTSGVLLLALDSDTHRQLSQQFQQRQVQKVYQAIVAGHVAESSGMIDLPLWGDPTQRPRQAVDWQCGKPSQTKYDVLGCEGSRSRVALYPLTGRTHQLRVHAAHPQGLNAPIWGDRLYGDGASGDRNSGDRLHLHAHCLSFTHPHRAEVVTLEAAVPF